MSHEFLEGKGPKHDIAVQGLNQVLSGFSRGEVRLETALAQLLLKKSFGATAINGIVDWYWAGYVDQYVLPVCKIIYDTLEVKEKTSPSKSFRFGDDRLWLVDHKGLPEYKVFVHALQSTNFIYFFNDRYLNVRQFFNEYKIRDEFDKRDEEDFKKDVQKHGKKWALRQEYQLDEYANDVLKSPAPTRFSYKYFTSPKFKFEYEDRRDPGYVISTRFASIESMNAVNNHSLLKCLFNSCLTQALSFLCGYQHHCYLSKYFDANGDFKPELDDE